MGLPSLFPSVPFLRRRSSRHQSSDRPANGKDRAPLSPSTEASPSLPTHPSAACGAVAPSATASSAQVGSGSARAAQPSPSTTPTPCDTPRETAPASKPTLPNLEALRQGPLIIQRVRTPTQSSVPGTLSCLFSQTTTGRADMSKPWTRSPRLEGIDPPMPECWGHRGASASFPENTIASFEMAIRDGADGLESDVHITSDDVVIMFHDPSLERTTDGSGLIREQPWHNKIENMRTLAAPHQQIPTFHQVCELLMQPANTHVKLNIDIKPENDPDRLFRLMRRSIESFPNFAEDLAPRLILGLWHPKFLRAALEHVPTMRRVHIGGSPVVARTYFWKHCDGFSMWFPSLIGADGQNFLEQSRREGKDVYVWTVNRRDEMVEATRWGVKAILTDETAMMQTMRKEMSSDYVTTRSERVGMFFRWATWRYWMLPQFLIQAIWISELERRAGITFKQAWKDDALQANDPPAVIAAEAREDDSDSVPSDATLANENDIDAARLVREKELSDAPQAAIVATPVAVVA